MSEPVRTTLTWVLAVIFYFNLTCRFFMIKFALNSKDFNCNRLDMGSFSSFKIIKWPVLSISKTICPTPSLFPHCTEKPRKDQLKVSLQLKISHHNRNKKVASSAMKTKGTLKMRRADISIPLSALGKGGVFRVPGAAVLSGSKHRTSHPTDPAYLAVDSPLLHTSSWLLPACFLSFSFALCRVPQEGSVRAGDLRLGCSCHSVVVQKLPVNSFLLTAVFHLVEKGHSFVYPSTCLWTFVLLLLFNRSPLWMCSWKFSCSRGWVFCGSRLRREFRHLLWDLHLFQCLSCSAAVAYFQSHCLRAGRVS